MKIIRLRRPHQLGRPPNSTYPEGARLHIKFVVFYSCLHQGSEYNFLFFWPRVETDKELQGQREWTDTSNFNNGFSNDYPSKLSISGNGPTSLIWSFSMTLNVTSQTTLRIVDWPYKPTRVFSTCFVLTSTLTGELPGRSPIQRLLQVKHA